MSSSTTATAVMGPVVCGGCGKRFAWKPELAGKRVRCKCGGVITIPAPAGEGVRSAVAVSKPAVTKPAVTKPAAAVMTRQAVVAPKVAPAIRSRPLSPQQADDFDALAALAADAEAKVAELPLEVRDEPAPRATAAPATSRKPTMALPPGYRRSAVAAANVRTAADRSRDLTDPVRDQYVPSILLAVGVLIYAGCEMTQHHVDAGGLGAVIVGLSIVETIKTALLVGGAFLLAGPLGVGFGDVRSAVLKLAAIAVLTDGVAAWIDYAMIVGTGTHGHSGPGYGVLGWAVSIGMYWGLMVYLFSMDAGDARLVVVCLSFLGWIVRVAAVLIAVALLVGRGPSADADGPSATPAAPAVKSDELSTRVDELKANGQLTEARQYIGEGHQQVALTSVDAWYAAGAPHVWYEMSGQDINGRRNAREVIVQMPATRAARQTCLQVLKQYDHDVLGTEVTPEELTDDGESYMVVPLRG